MRPPPVSQARGRVLEESSGHPATFGRTSNQRRLGGHDWRSHRCTGLNFHHRSPAGHPVYHFVFHHDSVFAQVLRRYGLINNKHIAPDILCDTIDVRRQVVAGLMDSDGHYTQHNCHDIKAKHRRQIEGYRELARSLSMRAGHRLRTQCTNEEMGQVYDGYGIILSGAMWEYSHFCVLAYKRAKQPGDAGFVEWPSGSRSYTFTQTAAQPGPCVRFDVDAVTVLPLLNNAGVIRRRVPDRHFLAEDYTVLG